MRLPRPSALFAALLLCGCEPPPEAPTELGDLALFFFSEFETADDAYMADALMNLEGSVFADVNLDGERAQRQWIPPILEAEHLGGAAAPPDVSPDAQLPITVAKRSTHPVQTHAIGVLEPDQSQLEPSAPEHDRTYVSDTACWEDSSCPRIDTENLIKKSNILYTIVYDTEKDFRRLELPDGRAAMVARTWNEERAFGDEGRNSIDQNFAAEVWIESADDPDTCQRMMSVWSSVTLGENNPEDEIIRRTIGLGLDTLFNRHDAFYDGE